MARPKKVIDYKMVEKLANLMCTQAEIANVLDVSTKTLQRDEEFCRIYKKGMDMGRMSLRRAQWKMVESSATMAIWLGKQYLGQKDTIRQEIEGDLNTDVKIYIPENHRDGKQPS